MINKYGCLGVMYREMMMLISMMIITNVEICLIMHSWQFFYICYPTARISVLSRELAIHTSLSLTAALLSICFLASFGQVFAASAIDSSCTDAPAARPAHLSPCITNCPFS